MGSSEKWTICHFSQANPKGDGQDDVTALLRRVADTIDSYGNIEVQDLVLHRHLEEGGNYWPSITVYYYD